MLHRWHSRTLYWPRSVWLWTSRETWTFLTSGPEWCQLNCFEAYTASRQLSYCVQVMRGPSHHSELERKVNLSLFMQNKKIFAFSQSMKVTLEVRELFRLNVLFVIARNDRAAHKCKVLTPFEVSPLAVLRLQAAHEPAIARDSVKQAMSAVRIGAQHHFVLPRNMHINPVTLSLLHAPFCGDRPLPERRQ